VPDETADLQAILAAREVAGVRYVLIGGLAMVAHGSAHVTQDVDMTYSRDPENLALLAKALAPLKPQLRDAPPGLPFMFGPRTLRNTVNLTLETALGEMDTLGEVPGVASFDELWDRSRVVALYGYPVHIGSLADLITMKRVSDRPKDRLHLMELEALIRINPD
jgi:hypothetical protein